MLSDEFYMPVGTLIVSSIEPRATRNTVPKEQGDGSLSTVLLTLDGSSGAAGSLRSETERIRGKVEEGKREERKREITRESVARLPQKESASR